MKMSPTKLCHHPSLPTSIHYHTPPPKIYLPLHSTNQRNPAQSTIIQNRSTTIHHTKHHRKKFTTTHLHQKQTHHQPTETQNRSITTYHHAPPPKIHLKIHHHSPLRTSNKKNAGKTVFYKKKIKVEKKEKHFL